MSQRPLLIDAGWQLGLLGGALVLVALALVPIAGLGWPGIAACLLAYATITALILAGLDRHAPHRRFGPANRVTLVRAAFAALLIGILAAGVRPGPAGRWALLATGTVALLLDGVDGWAARRTGLASPFGARFDMESDALFVLALSALVYRSGQADAWVLTAGLMRYIFVVAGWLWPPLAAPLPPSQRRKAVCVILIVTLLAALAPPVGPIAARWLCFGGLLLLTYSFGADCVRLAAAASRPWLAGDEVPGNDQI